MAVGDEPVGLDLAEDPGDIFEEIVDETVVD